MTRFPYFRCNL